MAKPTARRHASRTAQVLETTLVDALKADEAGFAKLWHVAFGQPAPTLNRKIAQACLIYRLQEQQLGGLSKDGLRNLSERMPAASTDVSRAARTRRYKAGTRLLRTWRGQTYVVTIASPGYLFDGRVYRSLSVIAREITGTTWSGPVFFGLRTKSRPGTEA
jgi:hypothetical protein